MTSSTLSTLQPQFDAASLALAGIAGDGLLQSSMEAGWKSMLVLRRRLPREVESFETQPTPDRLLGLVARGTTEFGVVERGVVRRFVKHTGLVMTTEPLQTHRMSWRTLSDEPYEVVSAFVPQVYFDEAAEEFRRAGTVAASSDYCPAGPNDATVAQVLQSLALAAAQGMPDSYADSAARFLATHLLSTSHRWDVAVTERGVGQELTDRRLARVLEYLEHRHREDVSNQQLAEVAGISPFHFTRLFKRKVGCTPHRYVQQLRMQSARKLLRGTDLSVLDVAAACGYANPSHFAAAFCRVFGQNPGEFRGSLG
jgi:AraC family transcriptional regulator